jgi:hypothetical protein
MSTPVVRGDATAMIAVVRATKAVIFMMMTLGLVNLDCLKSSVLRAEMIENLDSLPVYSLQKG